MTERPFSSRNRSEHHRLPHPDITSHCQCKAKWEPVRSLGLGHRGLSIVVPTPCFGIEIDLASAASLSFVILSSLRLIYKDSSVFVGQGLQQSSFQKLIATSLIPLLIYCRISTKKSCFTFAMSGAHKPSVGRRVSVVRQDLALVSQFRSTV